MELVGMVLIVAATGVLILWPLLRRTDSSSAKIAIAPADRGREKEMALAAIRELEFDYATGKISPEDYAVLRARYEAKALEAITQTAATPAAEGGGGGRHLEVLLEEEIAAARGKSRCVFCGESLPREARFCPSFGAPAPQGAISGAVQNLTGGKAKAVGGQTVTLTIYVNNAEVDKKTATTDARGAFTFAVPADPARTYLVTVKYKGGDYDSPQVTFKVGEIAKQVTMRVYEPTTDASVLRVNIQHMIVEPGEGLVQITELLVFANPTDRTYVGAKVREDGKRETLQFRLPDGAANVSYLEGLMECCVFAAPGGFLDTMDVKPGTAK